MRVSANSPDMTRNQKVHPTASIVNGETEEKDMYKIIEVVL